jgi:hypothetical protein
MVFSRASRCGGRAEKAQNQGQSERHGYAPLLGGSEHPLLLPRVKPPVFAKEWLPFSKRDDGHFVREKWSRPRCAVVDSFSLGKKATQAPSTSYEVEMLPFRHNCTGERGRVGEERYSTRWT